MPIVRITANSSSSPDAILRALRDPSPELFKKTPVIYFKSYRELGTYEMRIRFRRFITTVVDTIHFMVMAEENMVVYESLEPGKFRAVFRVSGELGRTSINVKISYKTQLKGAAIEKIFRRFIKNLEDIASTIDLRTPPEEAWEGAFKSIGEKPKSLGEREKAVAEPPTTAPAGWANCKTCLLYEASVNMCAYFMKRVENPEKPLCDGDKYIRAPT